MASFVDPHPDEDLAASFRGWAEHAGDSPLYQHLATAVADDPELLELAARIPHTPRPNLLLAAVQLLLTPSDALAAYYPSKGGTRHPDASTYPEFRDFVLTHAERIIEIGRTRYTQTNEPRRTTVLLPWLVREAEKLGEPVELVEVGAAAGLNLCFDHYTHRYRSGHTLGSGTPVLHSEDRGRVPLPVRFPRIGGRTGLDLHPLDLHDPTDRAWALALIWPEQEERRRRLVEAARVRRTVPVRMVQGDAAASLPAVLASLVSGAPALVWHSFVWNQLDSAQREAFDAALHQEARSVQRIGFEFWDRDLEWPEIRVGLDSGEMQTVARAHPHGAWVETVDPA